MVPLAALSAFVLGAAPARAGFFELSGSLQVNTSGKAPVADDPTTGGVVITYGSTTLISMSSPGTSMLPPGTDLSKAASGLDHIDATGLGTDVTFGLIDVQTDHSTTYQEVAIDFNYSLTLTDYATSDATRSLGTGLFQVSGRVSGSIGGGKKVNLNQIQSYAMMPSDGNVFAGSTPYTISNLLYIPAGANFPGVFTAHISAVPEPGTLALVALGGLGVWTARRRRRAARA